MWLSPAHVTGGRCVGPHRVYPSDHTRRYVAQKSDSAVLSAQQAVTGGEDQLAQAEAARAQDVVGLYRALGGGWSQTDTQETTP